MLFLTKPDDDLKCLICLQEVAEEPWQHGKCGRLFCEKCLENLGRDKPCPNCRMEHPQYFEDYRGKREIYALPVKCSSVERGCEWEGTVGTLEEHMATCKFTLVPCCKDANNEVRHFMRKDLDKHREKECPNRDYECEHCGEKGTYAHITQVHDGTCGKKVLPCPNAECTETKLRQNMIRHLEDCDYTEIPCKYQKLGCAMKMKRIDRIAHEDDEDSKIHFHVALDTIKSLQDIINYQQYRMDSLQDEITTLKNKQLMTFALSEYWKKKEANKIFTYPSVYTNGYHVALKVYVNGYDYSKGTHVSVFAIIRNGKYDAGLKWPFIGCVIFTLLNQIEDKNHHTGKLLFVAEDNAGVGDVWGYSKFILRSKLAHDPVKSTQYLKDDTLYFRLSVEVADQPWLECIAK